MPAPIPYAHREEIVRRKQAGESLRAIAAALGYSYWGVRKIWRQYRKAGSAGLQVKYRRGEGRVRKPPGVYQQAIALKQAHPRWGAGLIRSLLLQQWSPEEVPSERTLQRWWRRAGLNQRHRRGVRQQKKRAQQVHEVWQVDGVEVKGWSWITVTDEYSGATLAGRLFPLWAGESNSAPGSASVLPGGDGPMGEAPAHPGG